MHGYIYIYIYCCVSLVPVIEYKSDMKLKSLREPRKDQFLILDKTQMHFKACHHSNR